MRLIILLRILPQVLYSDIFFLTFICSLLALLYSLYGNIYREHQNSSWWTVSNCYTAITMIAEKTELLWAVEMFIIGSYMNMEGYKRLYAIVMELRKYLRVSTALGRVGGGAGTPGLSPASPLRGCVTWAQPLSSAGYLSLPVCLMMITVEPYLMIKWANSWITLNSRLCWPSVWNTGNIKQKKGLC